MNMSVASYNWLLCATYTVLLCLLCPLLNGTTFTHGAYVVQVAGSSWQAATDACVEQNGRLATPKTSDEVAELGAAMRDLDVTSCWVSARSTTADWAWLDGQLLDNNNSRWYDGIFPSPDSVTRDACGLLFRYPSTSYWWRNESCTARLPFICQYDSFSMVSNQCEESDPDYTTTLEDCYVVNYTQRLTWHEAAHYCKSRGGQLADLHDNRVFTLVTDLIRESASSVDVTGLDLSLWIGLSCNQWRWEVGGETEPVTGSLWSVNEPSLSSSSSCMYLHQSDASGQHYGWATEDCRQSLPYVCHTDKCRHDPETTPARASPPAAASVSSPSSTPTSGLTSAAPLANDKSDGGDSNKAAITGGLVFLCILLLLIFACVLVVFLCYVRRGKRLREKARLQAQGERGHQNQMYQYSEDPTGNAFYQQDNSSSGQSNGTTKPDPVNIFTVTNEDYHHVRSSANGIRNAEDVSIYNERSVDKQEACVGSARGTGEVKSNGDVTSRSSKQSAEEKRKSQELNEMGAVLVSTRHYGGEEEANTNTKDNSQNTSKNKNAVPDDYDFDEEEKQERRSQRRKPTSRPSSARRNKHRHVPEEFGSRMSLRDVSEAKPQAPKRRHRTRSVDHILDDDRVDVGRGRRSSKSAAMVSHGSMVSIRKAVTEDLYADDDVFAAVDVSSSRRMSTQWQSQGSLHDVDEGDSDSDRRRRQRRKQRSRSKQMNASLPSLRGLEQSGSEMEDLAATDVPFSTSRSRHDPEDPRNSQRSARGAVGITHGTPRGAPHGAPHGTPRSSRRGNSARPSSGKRPSSGRRDVPGTPRSQRSKPPRPGGDGYSSDFSQDSNKTYKNTKSSNDSALNYARGNYFDGDGDVPSRKPKSSRSEEEARRRRKKKDRRASDSSRASLRDRDFESDEYDPGELDRHRPVRDSRREARDGHESVRRSASRDSTRRSKEHRAESGRHRHNSSKRSDNDEPSHLRRSGSKRNLLRHMSQESLSSGAGHDGERRGSVSRRGSTASLIKVQPLGNKDSKEAGSKTSDDDTAAPDTRIDLRKDTLVDSGAWSKKDSEEAPDLDQLVETYRRVATDEMAFEMTTARNTGREENDMNIMSVDFNSEEVFEV